MLGTCQPDTNSAADSPRALPARTSDTNQLTKSAYSLRSAGVMTGPCPVMIRSTLVIPRDAFRSVSG